MRSPIEAEADDERQIACRLDAADRRHCLLEGEERLHHEQVDATLGKRRGLLGVGGRTLVRPERSEWLGELTGRTERTGHENSVSCSLPGDLHGTEIDVARAAG